MGESAAAWFRRARLHAGYASQAELATALGLSRAAVANWESEGVGGRPSRSVMPRLASLIAVSPEELAGRFGVKLEGLLWARTGPEPDLLAAIEDAVARGVARGLHEALDDRRDESRTHVERSGADGGAGRTSERSSRG